MTARYLMEPRECRLVAGGLGTFAAGLRRDGVHRPVFLEAMIWHLTGGSGLTDWCRSTIVVLVTAPPAAP